jgi:hypothetical protein
MKKLNLLFLIILLVACEENNQQIDNKVLTKEQLLLEAPTEIKWENLIPEAYSPEAIAAKYEKQLDQLEEVVHDSKIDIIYKKMMKEIYNAPLNQKIDKKWIKLSGFVAPLTYKDGKIIEFLLVPEIGACIHVPPPPINQTILVKTAAGYGINPQYTFDPFLVSGQIQVDGKKTDIGEAGYSINNAVIEEDVIDEQIEINL